jgi:hypothetical protein
MSNHFLGRGNLGADPKLKHVELEGESRTVVELRIYDRPIIRLIEKRTYISL